MPASYDTCECEKSFAGAPREILPVKVGVVLDFAVSLPSQKGFSEKSWRSRKVSSGSSGKRLSGVEIEEGVICREWSMARTDPDFSERDSSEHDCPVQTLHWQAHLISTYLARM
jgi:hypothetical protein